MRKFAVVLAFLYYLENYRKNPTVASFQLTTRNLKLLFYFVHCRLLCTTEHGTLTHFFC